VGVKEDDFDQDNPDDVYICKECELKQKRKSKNKSHKEFKLKKGDMDEVYHHSLTHSSEPLQSHLRTDD
jgi:predicted RNA-binding protein YlxR (DUF448 family)